MNQYVGTTIYTDDSPENIQAIFSVIPFYKFKSHPIVQQIKDMLLYKYNDTYINSNNVNLLNKILKANTAFLINDRIINLPQNLIMPALNLVVNEINECFNDEEENGKVLFGFEYFIIYSKFMKDNRQNKRRKIDNTNNNNNIYNNNSNNTLLSNIQNYMFYKEELLDFIIQSDIYFEWKIPYQKHGFYNLENETESMYMMYIIIKSENFYKIIYELNNK